VQRAEANPPVPDVRPAAKASKAAKAGSSGNFGKQVNGLAALQKCASGQRGEAWPKDLLEAVKHVKDAKVTTAKLGGKESCFGGLLNRTVGDSSPAIVYKGVTFVIQNVNGKHMVVAQGGRPDVNARAITQNFLSELKKAIDASTTGAAVDGADETNKTVEVNNSTVKITGGIELEFPGPAGSGETLSLLRDSSGGIIINPEKMKTTGSPEEKFVETIKMFKDDGQIGRLKRGISAMGEEKPSGDENFSASFDSRSIEEVAELVGTDVEGPRDDKGDAPLQSVLCDQLKDATNQIGNVPPEKLRQRTFNKGMTKLDKQLGGNDGDGSCAHTFLRAIRMAKDDASVPELYKALGRTLPPGIKDEALKGIVRMGRDLLSVATLESNDEENLPAAMAGLASELTRKPVAVLRPSGEDGKLAGSIFCGYNKEPTRLSSVDPNEAKSQIPKDAIALQLSPGSSGPSPESSESPTPSPTKQQWGTITGCKGTKVQFTAFDLRRDEQMRGEFVPQCTNIEASQWSDHQANGNCAIYSIHDAMAMVDGKNTADSACTNLRQRMYDVARKEFNEECGKFDPVINQNLLLNITRDRMKKQLGGDTTANLTSKDRAAILAEYNRLLPGGKLTLDMKPSSGRGEAFNALIGKAFEIATISTNKSWMDTSTVSCAAKALNRPILVISAEDSEHDATKATAYRLFSTNGDETILTAGDDGVLSLVKEGSEAVHPQIPQSALIIGKLPQHFVGPSELRETVPGHEINVKGEGRLGVGEHTFGVIFPAEIWEGGRQPAWITTPPPAAAAEVVDDIEGEDGGEAGEHGDEVAGEGDVEAHPPAAAGEGLAGLGGGDGDGGGGGGGPPGAHPPGEEGA
jgi:hypothetical protein